VWRFVPTPLAVEVNFSTANACLVPEPSERKLQPGHQFVGCFLVTRRNLWFGNWRFQSEEHSGEFPGIVLVMTPVCRYDMLRSLAWQKYRTDWGFYRTRNEWRFFTASWFPFRLTSMVTGVTSFVSLLMMMMRWSSWWLQFLCICS
jgi:hypothetical protein